MVAISPEKRGRQDIFFGRSSGRNCAVFGESGLAACAVGVVDSNAFDEEAPSPSGGIRRAFSDEEESRLRGVS
jgi:hypothetical protein